MTDTELLQWVRDNRQDNIVEFPEEVLRSLSDEQARLLAREFGSDTMVRLPASDVRFFEWLRREDAGVWNDLWKDEVEPVPYVVGMALLPDVLRSNRGFPICDLVELPNFYFTHKHVRGEEARPYLEAVRLRLENGEELGVPELLLLEISQEPIDIWRFAYLYRIPVGLAKQAVQQLVEDEMLVYTPTRDELSDYLDFPEEQVERRQER